MKKTYALALLLVPSLLMADTSRNPDRVPSFGLEVTHIDGSDVAGANGLSIGNGPFMGDAGHNYSHKSLDFTGDLRLPVTNWLTLNVLAGNVSQAYTFGSALSPTSTSFNEFKYGAGLRIYLQK